MKRIHIKTFIGIALMALCLMQCTKILDEQPRSIYEPGFFKTEKGVNGGLTVYVRPPALHVRTSILL